MYFRLISLLLPRKRQIYVDLTFFEMERVRLKRDVDLDEEEVALVLGIVIGGLLVLVIGGLWYEGSHLNFWPGLTGPRNEVAGIDRVSVLVEMRIKFEAHSCTGNEWRKEWKILRTRFSCRFALKNLIKIWNIQFTTGTYSLEGPNEHLHSLSPCVLPYNL